MASDAFLDTQRIRIANFAERWRLPAIHASREYAVAGGLMSYGPFLAESYRLAGVYTARILQGAKPSELPVQQVDIFELVINMATARGLGLEAPAVLLKRASELIE